jgi:hypothetical protein
MDSPFSQYNAEYPMASEPTVLHQSQLHSPVRLETEPERSSIHTHASTVQGAQTHRSPDAGSVATHTRHQSGSKRKRSPPRRFSTRDERKKVSRACDLCKM